MIQLRFRAGDLFLPIVYQFSCYLQLKTKISSNGTPFPLNEIQGKVITEQSLCKRWMVLLITPQKYI